MLKQADQLIDSASDSRTPAVAQPELPHTNSEAQRDSAIAPQSQQQQAIPLTEKTTVEWHKLIGAARLMWSKISEAELLSSKGDEQNLTDIVSSRYVLSRGTANTQVKKFLANQIMVESLKPTS